MRVLISCEVGGDAVPAQFISTKLHDAPSRSPAKRTRALRAGQLPARLSADQPAKYVVDRLISQLRSTGLHAEQVTNPYSIDLVDVSRSLHHRQLFSPQVRKWSSANKQQLLETIYHPYRTQVSDTLKKMLAASGEVVHLSVRTFPLRSAGKLRRADMGLLYDPACEEEVDLCLDWIDEMYDEVPMLRVRRNYPRRGTVDSITKAMRFEFADQNYVGIEMMINRAWVGRPTAIRDEVIDGIGWTLQTVLPSNIAKAA